MLHHQQLWPSDICQISLSQCPSEHSYSQQEELQPSNERPAWYPCCNTSLLQLCHHAPHNPTTTHKIIALLNKIWASWWSTVWMCHPEVHEDPFVIKLVAENDSAGVPNYIYEMVLKESSLISRFHGMSQWTCQHMVCFLPWGRWGQFGGLKRYMVKDAECLWRCDVLHTTQTLSKCGSKGGTLYQVTMLCTVVY